MSNEASASAGNVEVDGRVGEPPVLQELGLRAGPAGGAGRGTSGPASRWFSFLRPVLRAVGGRSGWPSLTAVPAGLPQLQPRLPHRSRPPPRPLVRRVRQVRLHRPDPRPVPAGADPRRDLPGPRAARRRGARADVPHAARPRRRTSSRSSAWAMSTSAGWRCCWPPPGPTGVTPVCWPGWPTRCGPPIRRWPSPMRPEPWTPPPRGCSGRARPRRAGAVCARRSRGLIWPAPASACGAWASRVGPTCARLVELGVDAGPRRRPRAAAAAGGSGAHPRRCWPPTPAGSTRWRRARSW